MTRRAAVALAVVSLLLGFFGGLFIVNRAYRPAFAGRGSAILSGTARVTGVHEVALDIGWTWAVKNPRPGITDEIVVLAPSEWQSAQAPGTREPVNYVSASEVTFWSSGGPADGSMLLPTGTVKACAAVTPNVDGTVTVYLNTDGEAAEFHGEFTLVYIMADVYPVQKELGLTHPPTWAERFLTAVGLPLQAHATRSEIHFGLNPPERPVNMGLPPQIKELLPEKAEWFLYGAPQLKLAESILGSQEVRVGLEVIAESTRPNYGKYGEPRVLISPDGTQAAIIYEDAEKLIAIPTAWTGHYWSAESPQVLSKSH